MNRIIKEKEKFDRKKNNKIRKWWRENDYKVIRIILFPIWIYAYLEDKHKNKKYQDMKFTTELCKEYLDKVMPFMVTQYCSNAEQILISSSDDMGDIEFRDFYGSRIGKKYRKIERYFCKFYNPLKDYILTEYQIE